jgi:hypothetical protein
MATIQNGPVRPPLKPAPQRDVRSKPEAIPPGDYRDPEIFDRLNTEINRDAAAQHARKRRTHKPAAIPRRLMPALERDVDSFTKRIRCRYPTLMKKRARPTKKLIQSLIGKKLPPYPRRPGRPQKPEITRAAYLLRTQQREIRRHKRQRVDWDEIAAACIPGWAGMREFRRTRERNKLRNSACARKVRHAQAHQSKRVTVNKESPVLITS